MKMYLATLVLCIAIVLITFGIHTNNSIHVVIGGFLIGIYDIMISKRD